MCKIHIKSLNKIYEKECKQFFQTLYCVMFLTVVNFSVYNYPCIFFLCDLCVIYDAADVHKSFMFSQVVKNIIIERIFSSPALCLQ